jgi:hypothetical protein
VPRRGWGTQRVAGRRCSPPRSKWLDVYAIMSAPRPARPSCSQGVVDEGAVHEKLSPPDLRRSQHGHAQAEAHVLGQGGPFAHGEAPRAQVSCSAVRTLARAPRSRACQTPVQHRLEPVRRGSSRGAEARSPPSGRRGPLVVAVRVHLLASIPEANIAPTMHADPGDPSITTPAAVSSSSTPMCEKARPAAGGRSRATGRSAGARAGDVPLEPGPGVSACVSIDPAWRQPAGCPNPR